MSYITPDYYMYEADTHCPMCAEAAFGVDEHGDIPTDAVDSEGNPITAVLESDHDPEYGVHCGTCREWIIEPDYSIAAFAKFLAARNFVGVYIPPDVVVGDELDLAHMSAVLGVEVTCAQVPTGPGFYTHYECLWYGRTDELLYEYARDQWEDAL